ncbi:unnamed protein product [Effrenium voratum]|nr:unnamed protein product [Effrenium voratum]
MLVLTSFARLLLLDSKGRRLVKQMDLTDSTLLSESITSSLTEETLTQKSRYEFELCLGGRRLRCRDTDHGAEAWLQEIAAAQRR